MTPRPVLPLGCTLGEGPVWDGARGRLWFTDIKQRRIFAYDPASGDHRSWDAPAQPGWVLPAEDGSLVAGLQGGLHRFDPEAGTFEEIVPVETDLPGNRLNDACVDAAGRILFGSMDDAEEAPTGRVHRFDAGAVETLPIDPVVITNGPALSPDGTTLYHVDTLGRAVHAIPLDRDGRPGAPRTIIRIEDGAGYPDGPTVDAEGCLWIGLFAGWAARRYAPDGTLLTEVRFPVANVTKIALGGPDLRTAYATTANKGLDGAARAAQPLAGDLFAFDVAVPGLPVPRVRIG